MDTNEYLTRVQMYIKTYIVLGGILLFSGLLNSSIFTLFQVIRKQLRRHNLYFIQVELLWIAIAILFYVRQA